MKVTFHVISIKKGIKNYVCCIQYLRRQLMRALFYLIAFKVGEKEQLVEGRNIGQIETTV